MRAVLLDDTPHCNVRRVVDLSLGGALVEGRTTLEVGAPAILALLRDDGGSLSCRARIAGHRKSTAGKYLTALRFDESDGEMLSALASQLSGILRSTVSALHPTVLVLEHSVKQCRFLQESLEGFGAKVLPAHSTVEAIWQLNDPKLHIQAVFIGTPPGPISPWDFARYMVAFPTIQCVVLNRESEDSMGETQIFDDTRHVAVLPIEWQPVHVGSYLLPESLAPPPTMMQPPVSGVDIGETTERMFQEYLTGDAE